MLGFFPQGQRNGCPGVQWARNLSVRRLCVQKNWGKCRDAVGQVLSLKEMVKTIEHVSTRTGMTIP